MSSRRLKEDIPEAMERLKTVSEEPIKASISPTALARELGIDRDVQLTDDSRPTAWEQQGGGDQEFSDQETDLGRFQMLGELGRGGMGRVLAAKDPELRRIVAVKVIIDPARVTEAQLARFLAEAQITSQLEHPNIVPVYDMGVTAEGEIYFVMRKVEGVSLAQVLTELKSEEPEAIVNWTRHRLLSVFIQVCNAVGYAHSRGVLHRDLKPDNIMLGRFGEVLLMDWGIARIMGDNTEVVIHEKPEGEWKPDAQRDLSPVNIQEACTLSRTQDGAIIGTPGFISPEQARGELAQLDERSDIWSLGAILYELLSLIPAYQGQNAFQILFSSVSGPPEDPRTKAPHRRIPDEVAEVCLKALQPLPDNRFPSAKGLGDAVEAFLEGSRRRRQAAESLEQAQSSWAHYQELGQQEQDLMNKEVELSACIEPWQSLEEKVLLLDTRRRIAEVGPERAELFSKVIGACERALSQDPGSPQTRTFLADVYWHRLEIAEASANRREQRYFQDRVHEYDDGRLTNQLKGTGSVSIKTDPPGAEVLCQRIDQTGLLWTDGPQRSLGHSPLHRVPLEMGSYLLTIKAPGCRDTRYPVLISRSHHWDSGDDAIPLFADEEIGSNFVYVPPGPFGCGGDPLASFSMEASTPWVDGFFAAIFPPTIADYFEFLEALRQQDPDEAWSRMPRADVGMNEGQGQYWDRPADGVPYALPEVDKEGDRWDPNWPVVSVSWEDARLYASWLSQRAGQPHRLIRELEWEKAARGVDGRLHPWGDDFDPAVCKVGDSRPGTPRPEPIGAFPTDCSVYGVRDMAGSVREWCGDQEYDGNPERRPIRGGAWLMFGESPLRRAASRSGALPSWVHSSRGFRLARSLPDRTE